MLQLKCTVKVQKFLRLGLENLSEVKSPNSLLGHWQVNLFFIDGRKTFLFMSEGTLLSFIMYGVRKDHVKAFPEIFLRGVDQLLSMEGFCLETINNVLSGYETFEYTPTSSRKLLGNMNDLTTMYKHIIIHEGGLKHCDLWSVISRINRTPQRSLGWASSIEVARELLEETISDAT